MLGERRHGGAQQEGEREIPAHTTGTGGVGVERSRKTLHGQLGVDPVDDGMRPFHSTRVDGNGHS